MEYTCYIEIKYVVDYLVDIVSIILWAFRPILL